MRNILIMPIIILIFLSSCVSKSEYEALKNQNIELQGKINDLEREIEKMKPVWDQSLIDEYKSIISPVISEKEAIAYVKDYYEFYRKGYQVNEIQVRKRSNNTFDISLKERDKSLAQYGLPWNYENYELEVNQDGKYSMRRK